MNGRRHKNKIQRSDARNETGVHPISSHARHSLGRARTGDRGTRARGHDDDDDDDGDERDEDDGDDGTAGGGTHMVQRCRHTQTLLT